MIHGILKTILNIHLKPVYSSYQKIFLFGTKVFSVSYKESMKLQLFPKFFTLIFLNMWKSSSACAFYGFHMLRKICAKGF